MDGTLQALYDEILLGMGEGWVYLRLHLSLIFLVGKWERARPRLTYLSLPIYSVKITATVCPLWVFPASISPDFSLCFLRTVLTHKLGHLARCTLWTPLRTLCQDTACTLYYLLCGKASSKRSAHAHWPGCTVNQSLAVSLPVQHFESLRKCSPLPVAQVLMI